MRLLSGVQTFYKAPTNGNYPPENVLELEALGITSPISQGNKG